MEAVLFIFWLLYIKAVEVLTKAPETRGPVSVFVFPGKIVLRGSDDR